LANVKETDFLRENYSGKVVIDKGFVYNMMVKYAYQKGFWVMKNGNEEFELWIKKYMHIKENIHYFKNLFKVPAQ
jgi:hypothetical protein